MRTIVHFLAATLCGMLLFATSALAAPSVVASLNPDKVEVGDSVILRVTVTREKGGVAEPKLPPLDGLTLVGTGSSSSFNMVNGAISRENTFFFTLRAERIAQVKIPPLTVQVGGKTYRSDPLTLNIVARGTLPKKSSPPRRQATRPDPFGNFPFGNSPFGNLMQPRAGVAEEDIQVDIAALPKQVYVGQQVLLTFRFHRAVDLFGNVQYTPPSTSGFQAIELQQPAAERRNEGGRPWVVDRRVTALFPLQPGTLTVGSALVRYSADPFSGSQQRQTPPLTITVKPLPTAGRPDGFDGVVGQYQLAAQVDRQRVRVGDAVTLSVTVSGQGNLAAIDRVELPDMPQFEVYDPEVEDQIQHPASGVAGQRTFRYVLIPRSDGPVPAQTIRLAVFNPTQAAYEVLTATLPALQVDPAPVSSTPPPAPSADPIAPADDVRAATEGSHALTFNQVWIGALIAALAMWLLTRRRRPTASTTDPEDETTDTPATLAGSLPSTVTDRPESASRALHLSATPPPDYPLQQALKDLDAAGAIAEDRDFFAALEHLTRSWLAACWQLPVSQITTATIGRHLAHDPNLQQQALTLLQQLEQARYAPPGGGPVARDALCQQARALLQGINPDTPAADLPP